MAGAAAAGDTCSAVGGSEALAFAARRSLFLFLSRVRERSPPCAVLFRFSLSYTLYPFIAFSLSFPPLSLSLSAADDVCSAVCGSEILAFAALHSLSLSLPLSLVLLLPITFYLVLSLSLFLSL